MCEEELRLNRRLALDLYLDMVANRARAEGLRVGGHGPIVEYAVRMRQFDASQELSALLEGDSLHEQEFVDLARRLAQFHEGAPIASCGKDFSHTTDLHDTVLGNLGDSALAPRRGRRRWPRWACSWIGPTIICTIRWLNYVCASNTAPFASAMAICMLRNIVRWHGQLIPFDGLEFDPKLRWIDVMNDVAFLVMDLMAHKRQDLALAFLNAYLERTGDYEGVRHLAFYSVYRSLVRAMVDAMGAERDLKHREDLLRRLRIRVQTANAFVNRRRADAVHHARCVGLG